MLDIKLYKYQFSINFIGIACESILSLVLHFLLFFSLMLETEANLIHEW